MSWLSRVASVFRPSGVDRAFDEEIAFHIESRIDDLIAAGMTRETAEAMARRQFGNRLRLRELSRDVKLMPWLEDLARDVDHGLRALRRTPVFASVAILTLALGIGANTAIFSIVNGVLLRPLAYPRPAQLMYLDTQFPALGFPRFWVSVAEYLEFQQFNRSFADVGAFRTGEANLVTGARALRVRSAMVDAHLLITLGVQPAQGRLFTSQETGLVGPPPAKQAGDGTIATQVASAAVISYELWQSAFGGGPIVGHSVDVDGRRVQVVGIMGRGADLMDNNPEIWLPLGFTDEERRERNNHNLFLIGRLKEGVHRAAAQAELNALIETWGARAGITPGPDHAGHVFLPLARASDGHIMRMTPLADQILGRAGRSVWVLQAAVGLVLLIACANVANLLIGRAETRQREFAVLTALGASRGRLVRKALTESMILSVAGGALGVLLARAGVGVLVRAYPASLPRIGEVAVDLRVMLMSLAVAVVCGLLFGLAPMMHTRSDAMAEALKSGAHGSTGMTRRHLRRALVMAETALAVIVVVGAGLLLRTVQNLTAVDAGFDRSRLVTFSITLPPDGSDLLGRVRAYRMLLEQLRAIPGVRMATAMTSLPLESPLSSYQTEIPDSTDNSGPSIPTINYYQRVMSGYFETMGIPILQGRGFHSTDAASEGRVAVVNETLANRYWKGRDPIGQRLRPCCGANGNPWFTVIGLAKDVKQSGVDQPAGTEAYLLVDQLATDSPTTWVAFSPTTMHVVVRTTLPLATLAPTIARVVRDVDPAVPVTRLREMDEVFTDSIRRPRLLAQLLTLFSVLAVLLAAIGIYGVLASMVAERRREMAIRLALGAERAQLLRQVMTQGLMLAGAGVTMGLAGVLSINRLLASLLFGVQPADVMTLGIVIPSIVGTAALACWLPAWRASQLDPNVILRVE
jgi:putative ABC transport system permease protein